MSDSVSWFSLLPALLLLAVAALLPGCDLFGSDGPGGPRLEDIPGKIVYVAERGDDEGNIYVTDQEGTRQLTSGDETGFVSGPAWSPDGERIAYSDGSGGTTLGPYLKLMNADGSGKRFLKEFEQESPQALAGWNPTWSPDGERIAYDICPNCELGGHNYEVVSIEVAGETYESSEFQALTDHPLSDKFPAWSPDGKHVAFMSDRAYYQADSARYRTDLYVVNSDGSDLRRLTEAGVSRVPTWSPNGKQIAFAQQTHGGKIFLHDIASGETTKLADMKSVGQPIWHSSGERLLVPGTTRSGNSVLQLMSLSGEVLKYVEPPEGATQIDWHTE